MVRSRPEGPFQPVCKAGTRDDQQPGIAGPRQSSGQVAEPDSRHGVAYQVLAIDVQRQCGPDAPPFSRADQRGIELSNVECVAAPQTVGDRRSNADHHHRIDQTSNPSAIVKTGPRWRRGWFREQLNLVLPQVLECRRSLLGGHEQYEVAAVPMNGATDTNGGQHE